VTALIRSGADRVPDVTQRPQQAFPGVALAATAFLVGGLASPALADPAGNNGT
jgi:hypothetical protein